MHPGEPATEPVCEDVVLFASELLRIGSFRCDTGYPYFNDTGPIHDYLIVFPRTPVLITHAGRSPVVADRCTIMFYNRDQEYRRDRISERGDHCDWFAFRRSRLVDAIEPFDRKVSRRPERPFSRTHGWSDAESYGAQRCIVEYLRRNPVADRLLVEEMMLGVLQRVIRNAYSDQGGTLPAVRSGTRRLHRDLAETTKRCLARAFRDDLSIDDIARQVHSSPSHLCRVFRRVTGMSLHGYRNQIRLRTALGSILDGHRDFSRLALEVGFSSHSHFTASFRQAFGVPPSVARDRPQHLRQRASA